MIFFLYFFDIVFRYLFFFTFCYHYAIIMI
nr:MAG TPA: hypothetical protein [Caudoviricetes sp.]